MPLFNKDEGNLVYLVPHDSLTNTINLKDFGNETTSNTDSFEGDKLVLTATEFFSKTETAVVSNYPVSNGENSGDHYRHNGAVINFRGVLSPSYLTAISLITGETLPPIQTYIRKVRTVIRKLVKENSDNTRSPTSPLVNIHLPDGNSVFNCVITDFKISRDVKVSDGYYVEITAKELLIADTSFSVKPKSDTFTKETNNGSGTGVNTDEESDVAVDLGLTLGRYDGLYILPF